MTIENLRLAVLIDGDNAPRDCLKSIMEEIAIYGTPMIKRIYGDWGSHGLTSWKNTLLENAVTPKQQFAYTTGKNATDAAMIIDAMDILYTGKTDGFVLVSSDSDFTPLAIRLRESGMYVIGIGEEKTPKAFVQACDKFIRVEVIRDKYKKPAKTAAKKTASTAKKAASKTPEKAEKAPAKTAAKKAAAPAADAKPPVPEDIWRHEEENLDVLRLVKSGVRAAATITHPALNNYCEPDQAGYPADLGAPPNRPVWPMGLGLWLLAGGVSLAVAVRRLAVPIRRLGAGTRIA